MDIMTKIEKFYFQQDCLNTHVIDYKVEKYINSIIDCAVFSRYETPYDLSFNTNKETFNELVRLVNLSINRFEPYVALENFDNKFMDELNKKNINEYFDIDFSKKLITNATPEIINATIMKRELDKNLPIKSINKLPKI